MQKERSKKIRYLNLNKKEVCYTKFKALILEILYSSFFICNCKKYRYSISMCIFTWNRANTKIWYSCMIFLRCDSIGFRFDIHLTLSLFAFSSMWISLSFVEEWSKDIKWIKMFYYRNRKFRFTHLN